jgi:hypothetical protein
VLQRKSNLTVRLPIDDACVTQISRGLRSRYELSHRRSTRCLYLFGRRGAGINFSAARGMRRQCNGSQWIGRWSTDEESVGWARGGTGGTCGAGGGTEENSLPWQWRQSTWNRPEVQTIVCKHAKPKTTDRYFGQLSMWFGRVLDNLIGIKTSDTDNNHKGMDCISLRLTVRIGDVEGCSGFAAFAQLQFALEALKLLKRGTKHWFLRKSTKFTSSIYRLSADDIFIGLQRRATSLNRWKILSAVIFWLQIREYLLRNRTHLDVFATYAMRQSSKASSNSTKLEVPPQWRHCFPNCCLVLILNIDLPTAISQLIHLVKELRRIG